MSRSRFILFLAFALGVGGLLFDLGGCSAANLSTGSTSVDAGAVRKDGAPVDQAEAGAVLDGGLTAAASCGKYCELVMSNCTQDNKQYDSVEQCLSFCAHLPVTTPMREEDVKTTASLGCRQYWADSPARTSPKDYCLAAGPFGGNECGDRCTTFCDVVLSACAPDGGLAVYPSQPECATACAGFEYRDGGTDGGGEDPSGPKAGNTLNCRLYHLRTVNEASCKALRPDGGACEGL